MRNTRRNPLRLTSAATAALVEVRSLLEALDAVAVVLRVSNAGVPHLVVRSVAGLTASVCWFGSNSHYRIFWPYPSDVQTRRDSADAAGVLAALREAGLLQGEPS